MSVLIPISYYHFFSNNGLLSLFLAIRCAVSVTSGQCATEDEEQVDCSPANACTTDSDCTEGARCNFLQPVSKCSDETFPACGGTCGRLSTCTLGPFIPGTVPTGSDCCDSLDCSDSGKL